MKVSTDPKLDFDDVLIVPQRSRTASRKQVELDREFTFYHSSRVWSGVPLMVANMDTTGTWEMSVAGMEHRAVTCLHKHYTSDDYKACWRSQDYQWMSIGIKDSDVTLLANTIRKTSHIPNLCIDVANGYTDDFVHFCAKVRKTIGNGPIIMAGNVCTPEMVQELILHGGVDIVKVGIGPGSACTTRLKTGCGYPQLSAIDECSHAAHGLKSGKGKLGLICADGGCRTPADVCKAYAAGADFVMLGGMVAGCSECEGEWEYEYQCHNKNGSWWQSNDPGYDTERRKTSLKFYGMSSTKAQEKYTGVETYRTSEGRVKTIPHKGPVSDVILDIYGGLRSSCAYIGATCLKDMSKCADFIRVNRTHFDQTV